MHWWHAPAAVPQGASGEVLSGSSCQIPQVMTWSHIKVSCHCRMSYSPFALNSEKFCFPFLPPTEFLRWKSKTLSCFGHLRFTICWKLWNVSTQRLSHTSTRKRSSHFLHTRRFFVPTFFHLFISHVTKRCPGKPMDQWILDAYHNEQKKEILKTCFRKHNTPNNATRGLLGDSPSCWKLRKRRFVRWRSLGTSHLQWWKTQPEKNCNAIAMHVTCKCNLRHPWIHLTGHTGHSSRDAKHIHQSINPLIHFSRARARASRGLAAQRSKAQINKALQLRLSAGRSGILLRVLESWTLLLGPYFVWNLQPFITFLLKFLHFLMLLLKLDSKTMRK